MWRSVAPTLMCRSYARLSQAAWEAYLNTRIASSCASRCDGLPASMAPTAHDGEFDGTIRLGSFDFVAGPARDGTWCTSARKLLGWKSERNSIQQFFQLVEPGDRAALEEEWSALRPGRPIDRIVCARIGAPLRYLRFVAGRSEEGSTMRIAGFIQDVTFARLSGPEGHREAHTSRLLNTFILLCK